ncbi:hypothetical protein ACQRBH_15940 [Bariatricus sp. SGI.161]|uniref:hypothetical protein n=1 Tax=Bariatricus sp. SGI.161 TaxID=3420550 RepID=UPI003D07F32F
MNNTKIATSLDDTHGLRKLILDNPDLPLVIFAGEESWNGEYSYNLALIEKVAIKELAWYEDLYITKDDFRDKMYDEHADDFTISGVLMKEELDGYVDSIMRRTEFLKAIVVYVG